LLCAAPAEAFKLAGIRADVRTVPSCANSISGGRWEGPPGLPQTREDADRGWTRPHERAISAMILPELRAILIRNPKCGSSALWSFFKNGSHPLFRRAGRIDGIGKCHLGESNDTCDYVWDLGETESSRKMKDDFFTFTFVCHPLHRLISAYGTITHRGDSGGGFWANAESCFHPPFTKMSRFDEPLRFNTFVQDLSNLSSTFEFEWLPEYASHPVWDERGRAWHHARTQMYYLTSSDSNLKPRRLDFIGKMENFREDLSEVLRRLGVAMTDLTDDQRGILNGNTRSNEHEGFTKTFDLNLSQELLTEARAKILKPGAVTDESRKLVLEYYKQDFACFDYTM